MAEWLDGITDSQAGSGVHRKRNKQASFGQVDAAN